MTSRTVLLELLTVQSYLFTIELYFDDYAIVLYVGMGKRSFHASCTAPVVRAEVMMAPLSSALCSQ